MKSKRILTFLLLMLIVVLFTNISQAGDKIKLKLHQPPPNKMPISSLWKLDIENTTKDNLTIYLEGTASGEKQGMIVEGKTNTFSVKPGKSTYGYDDFKSGEVNWLNKTIQEVIIRTGEVPSDVYTICVTAYFENGQIADVEQCITHPVERPTEGMISLISPTDGEEIDAETGLNFMWVGTGLKGPYTLKIAEIKGSQSKEEAIKTKGLFEKDKINSISFVYPGSAPKLMPGKKYAWMVTAEGGTSEIWTFSTLTGQHLDITFDQIICTGNTNEYKYRMTVTNTHLTDNLKIIGIQFYTPSSYYSCLDGPVITPTGQSLVSVTPAFSSLSISPNGGIGFFDIIVNKGSTADNWFNMRIKHQFNPPTGNGGFDCDSIQMPPCNCCDAFTKIVNNLNVSNVTGSNTNYILSGNIQAGPNNICKVQADMVYFSWKSKGINGNTDAVCRHCVKPSDYYGNFGLTPSPIGSLIATLTPNSLDPAYNFSREIIWTGTTPVNLNSSTPFQIPLSLPPSNSLDNCCLDSIKMCIRFSFTDVTCETCDTLVTVRFVRKPEVIMGLNENYRENLFDYLPEAGAITKEKTENLETKISSLLPPGYDVSFTPTGDNCCFNVIVTNYSTSGYLNAFQISSIGSNIISASPQNCTTNPSPVPPPVTTLNWIGNSYFAGGTTQCGKVCFDNTSSTFFINIRWSSNGGVTFGPEDDQDTLRCDSLPHSNNCVICVRKWVDGNGNNNYDNGEGIENIPFTFTPISGGPTLSGTTGPDGSIHLIILDTCGKTYTVTENLTGSGYTAFDPPSGIRTITSTLGYCNIGNTNNQFQNKKGSSQNDSCVICVRKWVDKAPFDGVYNVGEGIYNQPFVFTNGPGSPFTVYTNANGEIHKVVPCNTSYTVTETPIGYTPVDPPSGSKVITSTNFCNIDNNQFQNALTTHGSCDTCCTAFDNFKDYTTPVLTAWPGCNNVLYTFQTNITAGPGNFTEIRAAMINFHHISSNPDCDTCVKKPIFFGSMLGTSNIPWTLPSGGTVAVPSTLTCFSYSDEIWDQNPRETVWRRNGDSRPPLISVPVTLLLIFPPLYQNTCCCDTIAYSIRFTFEDAPPSCQACSIIICDTIIRCNRTGGPTPMNEKQFEEKLKKELKKNKQKEFNNLQEFPDIQLLGEVNKYDQNQILNSQGQSAGIINVNVNERTNVKLKVFDLQGKEVINVYDDYMKEGKYSFDLNNYNLAEGIYYYKLENNGTTDYQKVVVSKQSGCNCGKK